MPVCTLCNINMLIIQKKLLSLRGAAFYIELLFEKHANWQNNYFCMHIFSARKKKSMQKNKNSVFACLIN